MTPPVNLLAVLVAALASMVLGFLWYGPLFGKPWMAAMGFTKDSMDKAKAKGMTMNYVLMAVGSLVMAYVLSHVTSFAMAYMQVSGYMAGLSSGFWTWLGFILPVVMGDQLWGGKPWKLLPITAGYYLVSLMIMGAILASWA